MSRSGAVLLLLVVVLPAAAQDMPLSQILVEGQDWRVAADGFMSVRAMAADSKGRVLVYDYEGKGLVALHPGIKLPKVGKLTSLASGPDGALYGYESRRIVKIVGDKVTEVARNIEVRQLVVSPSGHLYCLGFVGGTVYLVTADGKKTVVHQGNTQCRGLTLWPDGGTLVLGPRQGKHLWALRVEKDGSLKYKEAYYELRVPPYKDATGAYGLTRDGAGRVYAATDLGVQVFDPSGRLSGVLPLPGGAVPHTLAFGDPGRDVLYAACGNGVFALKLRGTALWPKEKK
jgi:enterochelin esterase family protein